MVIITGYTGADGDVVIPEQIDGRRVIGIDDTAFLGCERLTTIYIPLSVTYIGGFTPRDGDAVIWGAFAGCLNLESVTIPGSVVRIGAEAFYECPNLTIICPPDSYAHRYCVENGIKFQLVERYP
ncbi:MAG: leucine-rich repeat domain-containing protein [Dehalococcoidia bacterium]|nr:leucine-rich repeat domain-containing protein [Dehalococcoidia bacterium]